MIITPVGMHYPLSRLRAGNPYLGYVLRTSNSMDGVCAQFTEQKCSVSLYGSSDSDSTS